MNKKLRLWLKHLKNHEKSYIIVRMLTEGDVFVTGDYVFGPKFHEDIELACGFVEKEQAESYVHERCPSGIYEVREITVKK